MNTKSILTKFYIIVSIVVSFIAAFVAFGSVFAGTCDHESMKETIIYPTCEKEGEIALICEYCGFISMHEIIPAKQHEWAGEYIITQPHLTKLGTKIKTCIHCGSEEIAEFACEHERTSSQIIQESTCTKDGILEEICDVCESVISTTSIPKIDHSYSAHTTVKEAAPGVDGIRRKTCSCGAYIEDTFSFSMAGPTSIYIPGTGINHVMNFGGYDQESVDAYNIVYVDQDEPWILGHKGRGLGNIYKAKVGQKMYLSINGVVSEYDIFVSEYATVDATGTFITGHTTGTCVQNLFGYGVLHIYTCYGSGNGRWILLARKVN